MGFRVVDNRTYDQTTGPVQMTFDEVKVGQEVIRTSITRWPDIPIGTRGVVVGLLRHYEGDPDNIGVVAVKLQSHRSKTHTCFGLCPDGDCFWLYPGDLEATPRQLDLFT